MFNFVLEIIFSEWFETEASGPESVVGGKWSVVRKQLATGCW
jgi:hypothetical protein